VATEQKIGSAKWVEHINQAYASIFTNFIVHCNRTGFEDGVNFWGGSTVFDPEGVLIAQGPYYEEALVTARLDLNQIRRTRTRLPLLRDERVALTIREMERIVDNWR
jgi:predicted amidohydrolase